MTVCLGTHPQAIWDETYAKMGWFGMNGEG
jgi:hypothetical protein